MIKEYIAVHIRLLHKGNAVSRAGGETVAEPLVIPQYPFFPSIKIELNLSPGLPKT